MRCDVRRAGSPMAHEHSGACCDHGYCNCSKNCPEKKP
jgi:hypothetical protein